MSFLQNLEKALSKAFDSYIQEKIQHHLEKDLDKDYILSLAKEKGTINTSLNASSADKQGLTIVDGPNGYVSIPVDTVLKNGAKIQFNYANNEYYNLHFSQPYNAGICLEILKSATSYISNNSSMRINGVLTQNNLNLSLLISSPPTEANVKNAAVVKFGSDGIIKLYNNSEMSGNPIWQTAISSVGTYTSYKFNKYGLSAVKSDGTSVPCISLYLININTSLIASSPDKQGLTIVDGTDGYVSIPVDTVLQNGAKILFRATKIASDNFPSYIYYTLLFTSNGQPSGKASNGFRIMNTLSEDLYGAGVPVLTSPSFDTGNYYLKFNSNGSIVIYNDSNTIIYTSSIKNTTLNTNVAFFKFNKKGITYLDSNKVAIGTIKSYKLINFTQPIIITTIMDQDINSLLLDQNVIVGVSAPDIRSNMRLAANEASRILINRDNNEVTDARKMAATIIRDFDLYNAGKNINNWNHNNGGWQPCTVAGVISAYAAKNGVRSSTTSNYNITKFIELAFTSFKEFKEQNTRIDFDFVLTYIFIDILQRSILFYKNNNPFLLDDNFNLNAELISSISNATLEYSTEYYTINAGNISKDIAKNNALASFTDWNTTTYITEIYAAAASAAAAAENAAATIANAAATIANAATTANALATTANAANAAFDVINTSLTTAKRHIKFAADSAQIAARDYRSFVATYAAAIASGRYTAENAATAANADYAANAANAVNIASLAIFDSNLNQFIQKVTILLPQILLLQTQIERVTNSSKGLTITNGTPEQGSVVIISNTYKMTYNKGIQFYVDYPANANIDAVYKGKRCYYTLVFGNDTYYLDLRLIISTTNDMKNDKKLLWKSTSFKKSDYMDYIYGSFVEFSLDGVIRIYLGEKNDNSLKQTNNLWISSYNLQNRNNTQYKFNTLGIERGELASDKGFTYIRIISAQAITN